jgi:hypothetical protein
MIIYIKYFKLSVLKGDEELVSVLCAAAKIQLNY